MEKLRNPYDSIPGYNCFGCAHHNPNGLKMEFYRDGTDVVSVWEPGENFQGYGNVLHGGVLAALLDELGAWTVMIRLETAGVTQEMTVRYHKTVYSHRGALTLRAGVQEQDGNVAAVHGRIFDSAGTMTTDADLRYFLFPQHIAKKRLAYPGVEAFLPE